MEKQNKNNRKEVQEKIRNALLEKGSSSLVSPYNKIQNEIEIREMNKAKNVPKTIVGVRHKGGKTIFNRRGGPRSVLTSGVSLPVMNSLKLSKGHVFETPDWFSKPNKKIDVSIVVPLYKSLEKVKEQIESWDLGEDGLNKEIIYVDDSCPSETHKFLVSLWEKKLCGKNKFVGKIIKHDTNGGYAQACNTGASFASGEYIIFLNADCVVLKNWIRPMYERICSDNQIGMVGNMQLKYINGKLTIDSAGSEWSWSSGNFDHIARHIYKGKPLSFPFTLENAPQDCVSACEREMVTGCCFIIRKSLFSEIDGFDIFYRIGYWEDSDINMKVRNAGYKIFYEPESKIFHDGGHSGSGAHPFMGENIRRFKKRWVDNGRFDKFIFTKRPHKLDVKTICVKRNMAHGDVLVAASVCAALRKNHPNAKIYFDTHLPHVLQHNPYVDYVVRDTDLKGYQLSYNLDLAYENRPKKHILQAYADEAGVESKDCILYIHNETIDLPKDKFIAFCPGKTAWVGRNWLDERWDELARLLKDDGYKIAVVGAKTDRGTKYADWDYRGKTSIYQSAYLIKHSMFYVGIDSFSMWLAQCGNVPGVSFFGCVDPKYRIVNENMKFIRDETISCIGCHHENPIPCIGTSVCKAAHTFCEHNITAKMFFDKIKENIK